MLANELSDSREQELVDAFGIREFPNHTFLDKCLSICRDFEISPNRLHSKWEAFIMGIGGAMTEETLRLFRDDLLQKIGLAAPPKTPVKLDDTPMASMAQERSAPNMLNGNSKVEAELRVKQEEAGRIWESGTNSGKIMISFGTEIGKIGSKVVPVTSDTEGGERIKTEKEKVDIRVVGKNLEEYRYMSEQVMTQANVLFDHLHQIATEVIADQQWNGIDQPNMPCSRSMNTVGILLPANTSSTASKTDFALEAITPAMNHLVRVYLKPPDSCNALPSAKYSTYGLVPGNVIACRGVNYNGNTFIVEEIMELPKLEEWELPEDAALHVLIFAGPFHLSGLSFDSVLESLQNIAKSESPDAVILIGPFISCTDSGHGKDAFATFMSTIKTLDFGCEVVYIPSTEDAFWGTEGSIWLGVPQPKSRIPLKATLCPNPCNVVINEVLFHITSLDPLTPWIANEGLLHTKPSSDNPEARPSRIRRVVAQMLEQRYIVNPMVQEKVVTNQWKDGCAWPGLRPNVILFPSKLAPSAMMVDETMVINPGCAVRFGAKKGSYARLWFIPESEGRTRTTDRCKVEIVQL